MYNNLFSHVLPGRELCRSNNVQWSPMKYALPSLWHLRLWWTNSMWKQPRFWYYGFHCACLYTEHCGTPAAQPPSVHQTAQPASCTVCLDQCRITAPLKWKHVLLTSEHEENKIWIHLCVYYTQYYQHIVNTQSEKLYKIILVHGNSKFTSVFLIVELVYKEAYYICLNL